MDMDFRRRRGKQRRRTGAYLHEPRRIQCILDSRYRRSGNGYHHGRKRRCRDGLRERRHKRRRRQHHIAPGRNLYRRAQYVRQ